MGNWYGMGAPTVVEEVELPVDKRKKINRVLADFVNSRPKYHGEKNYAYTTGYFAQTIVELALRVNDREFNSLIESFEAEIAGE